MCADFPHRVSRLQRCLSMLPFPDKGLEVVLGCCRVVLFSRSAHKKCLRRTVPCVCPWLSHVFCR